MTMQSTPRARAVHEADLQAKFAKLREDSGVSAMRPGTVPYWIMRKIAPLFEGTRVKSEPAQLREAAAMANAGELFENKSNWGTVVTDRGYSMLVVEPYITDDTTQAREAAKRFASLIGCEVILGLPSWRLPGMAVRYCWQPKPNQFRLAAVPDDE